MASNPDGDADDAPAFIDMATAVEVDVPDRNPDDAVADADDAAMEEDAGDDGGLASKRPPTDAGATSAAAAVDRSKATFASHGDAVYAVASYYDAASRTLTVASGGGDDRACLHRLTASASDDGSSPPRTATIPLSHPHTDSVSCLAFNAPYVASDVSGETQRSLLAAGSYDGSIVLYDAADGSLVRVLEGPSDVEWTTFHPKGGTVLLAGSMADGTVWMYHVPSHACLQVFVGHEGGVVAGAFTPDGRWVVSAGRDGTCRVWAPKTGMSRHVFRLVEGAAGGGGGGDDAGPGLTCLAVGGGADGRLAVVGGEDGRAHVVHVQGKKLVATLPHFEESQQQQERRNAHEDEMDEDIEGEARSVEAVGFCPPDVPGTAGWCATGGVDGALKIWNLTTAGAGGSAQLRQRCVRGDDAGGAAGITRLTWHATLPLVICSYTDGAVGVWDARTGALAGSLTGHGDMINDMSVNFVEGSNIAVICTGSDDRTVKVFEYNP